MPRRKAVWTVVTSYREAQRRWSLRQCKGLEEPGK